MVEKSPYKSSNRDGFNSKAKQMEREGFGTRVSPTGYTDAMLGMDDVDRLRRVKLDNKVNKGR
jgi:hypothetical protein